MRFPSLPPIVRLAAAVCLLAALPACALLHRHRPKDDTATQGSDVVTSKRVAGHRLDFEIKVSPDPVKLGEVRELLVNIVVRNVAKQAVTLKFPTYQILEMQLRDVGSGTVVSKWSTDRTFIDDTRIVPINRGEYLQYNEPITTRELKAGKVYNLEVYFVGYEKELFARKVLIPQP